MGSCGKQYGNSMSHQRSERLCGELVRISCQLVTICTGEEWTWIETVNSVANNLKRVHTCCGSVHLLAMFGLCPVGKCGNAGTTNGIFSSYSECWEEKLTMKELEQWATTTWAIWNARNRAHFEKLQARPQNDFGWLYRSTGFISDTHSHSRKHMMGRQGVHGFIIYGGYMFFYLYKEKLA